MNPKTKLKAKVDTKTTHLNRKSLSRLLPVRVVSNPDPVTPALGLELCCAAERAQGGAVQPLESGRC